MKKAYTFDDVALVPQYNDIDSRTEPDLSTKLTKNIDIGIPLLAANMDTVIGDKLTEILLKYGSVPIYHRFTTLEEQLTWLNKYDCNPEYGGGVCGLSIGVSALREKEDKTLKLADFIDKWVADYGLRLICIDVAHGHSKKMLQLIELLKTKYDNYLNIVAGNICTAMAFHDLSNAGADAVKVGIGPGAACTTRVVTGFGVPQFSAIYDCAEVSKRLKIPIIADGGIQTSGDIVKALAAGANTVMIGRLFAATRESAAKKYMYNDFGEMVQVFGERTEADKYRILVKYRGQASEEFQNEYYGGLKDKTVAEGESFFCPLFGSADKLIEDLLGGIRSGMTYGSARTIEELQRKAEFVEVTNSYIEESYIREN